MDSWRKYNISKVICHVEKEEHVEAQPYCSSAKGEFETIQHKININHRTKIDSVYTLIDNVEHMRVMKREDTEEAISIFHKYIEPFLEEEERKAAGGASANEGTNRAPYAESKSGENVLASKEYTKKPLERGVDGLVLAFQNLYLNGTWEGAFKELLARTNSEKLACECLLRTVQKAFEINRQEAEQQLSTAEECAKQIVRNGKFFPEECPKSGAKNSANELLRRYRYLHADLATERLKRVILQEVNTLLSNVYNLQFKGDNSLELFTCECAEVTWLMCVEDPPINMVHEDNLETIDRNNYEIVGGKTYKAILWPALKQEGYTNTVAKGILCSRE